MLKPITYSRKFFEMKFTAETMKAAYMNACKWYATNVLSKDEIHDIQVEFVKGYNEQQNPVVTIHLFAVLDESEITERYCKVCREMNNSFLAKKLIDCEKCELTQFNARKDETLRNKAAYYKELLSKTCGKKRQGG